MASPLLVLCLLSVFGGWLVSRLPLESVLPLGSHEAAGDHSMFSLGMGALSMTGIAIAWFFFHKNRAAAQAFTRGGWGKLGDFWRSGWGFDWLYDVLFVKPYMKLADINRFDIADTLNIGIAALARAFHLLFASSQTGSLRWYITSMMVGLVFTVLVVVIL